MPTKKRPAAKKATPAKKPAQRTAKRAAKPAAKAKAAPVTTASAAVQPPVFKVVTSTSRTSNAGQPEWWTNAVRLAQQNPAVTFVAIVAAALGLVLLFS